METGDLTLGMLSEDNSLEEDFLLDSKEESLNKDLDIQEDIKDKNKDKDTISEEDKPLESVAEKDKDKRTPDEAKPSPGNDNKMSQIYSSLATHFRDTGVLPSLNLEENEIKSVEDLQNAIKTEIDNGKSESQKAYEKAMSEGESQDAYVEYTKMKSQLDAITDEKISDTANSSLRYNIIAQDFLNKGFSKEEAIRHAKRSQDLGEDIEDAKSALERVKEFNTNSYQKRVQEEKKIAEEAVNKIKNFVKEKDEIIKGIKIPETTKNELIKQMTDAVARDENGNPLTKYGKSLKDNPVQTKVITEYMYLLTKGFTDFSKINTLVGSRETKNIDDILRSTGGDFLNTGKVDFNNNDNNSSFSIGDEFNLDI